MGQRAGGRSGTFPTSDLADGDSGKDMPFRFLDVDAKVDLVRGVAHLVFQNDLNFFFRDTNPARA
jgi:hypothetical protein